MPKVQYYDIRFPITVQTEDKTLFDLNYNKAEYVKSKLIHLLFTRTETRLRQPYFGTNLLKFLFNPSDDQTFDSVVAEIKEKVSKWVDDCTLNDMTIYESEDGTKIDVEIKYSVKEDNGEYKEYTYVAEI